MDGKVAIVTGGASGIGAAMVRALHAEGAKVVIADISGAEEALAAELGDGALAHGCDVGDDAAVHALVAAAADAFGRLDVLCNNAGIDGPATPLAEYSLEDFDRIQAVNLRAVFSGTRHAIPAMLEAGGGSIINTASIAGLVAFPGLSAYCASKAGVIGLTRVTAAEYAKAGIRANAICPGVVKTALLEHFEAENPEAAGQLLAAAEAMTPAGRVGAPAEIAGAAVFLASDESSFLTGAAIPVDGGYTTV